MGSTENMTGNLVMMPQTGPQREMEALSLGLPPGQAAQTTAWSYFSGWEWTAQELLGQAEEEDL